MLVVLQQSGPAKNLSKRKKRWTPVSLKIGSSAFATVQYTYHVLHCIIPGMRSTGTGFSAVPNLIPGVSGSPNICCFGIFVLAPDVKASSILCSGKPVFFVLCIAATAATAALQMVHCDLHATDMVMQTTLPSLAPDGD